MRWNSDKPVSQSEIESEMRKQGLDCYVWQDGISAYYPTHSHPYTEIRWVIYGSITFGVNGSEVTLYPGDCLELPSNVLHYAKTSDERVTVYLCASKP
ncbi:MAG: cupin domain-containing protein [Spirochaetota bacterium]|nr:cupin domain-containing protein [Spirochaetota bacterium]